MTREELLGLGRIPEKDKLRNAKWSDDFPQTAPVMRRIAAFHKKLHAIAKTHQLDAGKLLRRLIQGSPSDLEDDETDYGLAIALRTVSGRKRAETELKHARRLLETIRSDESTVGRDERECAVRGIIRRGEFRLQDINDLSKQYRIPKNVTDHVYSRVLSHMAADIYHYIAEKVPGKYYLGKPAKYKSKALELTAILVNAYYGKGGVVQWLNKPMTVQQIKSHVTTHLY